MFRSYNLSFPISPFVWYLSRQSCDFLDINFLFKYFVFFVIVRKVKCIF